MGPMSEAARTPYGHDLEPGLRDVLRGTVPTEAIGWVETEAHARVLAQRALDGGMSSALHLLTLDAPPPEDHVVLRRYVLDWVRDEPEIPGNEALALHLLGDNRAGIPAPRLIATDPDGSVVGVPATLMTAVSGSLVWNPIDRTAWLRSLAELAVAIHSLPAAPELSDWAPYAPYARTAPSWSRHPQAWLTAYRVWDGPAPTSERVFLHRDFHPGNVLWTDGVITGVVDWTSSCAGPPEEDIGHCRAILATHHGQDLADEFLACWQDLTGKRDYHPYWDLTNVVSFEHDQVDSRLDEFVAAAAVRL
jgi:aminoglycoside phosphotransferase (APT) family kinase protein